MIESTKKSTIKSNKKPGPIKVVLFSLTPMFILLLSAEIILYLLGLGGPQLYSKPLPEESYGAMQQDTDLMWALKPNQRFIVPSSESQPSFLISTNSQGLRGPEILAKQANEYRILSLGESSTFGAKVDNHNTYSAKLEVLLNKADRARAYRVINAGVPAYTSFQSLIYLKLRGIKLKPDMVLFYHEFNDYLPSSLRSSQNTEIGLTRTDKELYDSKKEILSRFLLKYSLVYSYLSHKWNSYLVSRFTNSIETEAAGKIGLNKLGALPRVLEQIGDKKQIHNLKHDALPRRVSDKERLDILKEVSDFCKNKKIELVIIHPSYLLSKKHKCILTEFCLENSIYMFEAQDFMHNPSIPVNIKYLDIAHPSPLGHQILADSLAPLILSILNKPSSK